MSQPGQTINEQLQEIAQSNKCVSKAGSNISALFVALKVKQTGDTSVIKQHMMAQRKMQAHNPAKEDHMQEEGRLKVIQSDLKRVAEYRNSVKDLRNVKQHLNDHSNRVKIGLERLEKQDPKAASKLCIASVIPTEQVVSSFRSPTRTQLQKYESKERVSGPTVTQYRPQYGQVERREVRSQFASPPIEDVILVDGELRQTKQKLMGAALKEQLFRRQAKPCNRLLDKMDRGFEIERSKMAANEAFLDEHPSGFNLKGSLKDHYRHAAHSSVSNNSGLLLRDHSPSIQQLTEARPARHSSVNKMASPRPTKIKPEMVRQSQRATSGEILLASPEKNMVFEDSDDEQQKQYRVTEASSSYLVPLATKSYDGRTKSQPKGSKSGSVQYTKRIFKMENNYASTATDGTSELSQVQRPLLGLRKKSIMISKVASNLSIQEQRTNSNGFSRSVTASQPVIPTSVKQNASRAVASQQNSVRISMQNRSVISQVTEPGRGSQGSPDSIERFGYDIKYSSNHYHLVQSRKNDYCKEDSMMIMPNRSTTSETRLPRVKMNLQTNRPPNLGQAHESRFDMINKNPTALSSFRKIPTVDFNKQNCQARHKCLIDEEFKISMQRYDINESLVTKRGTIGTLAIDKQLGWNQIVVPDRQKEVFDGVQTQDTVLATMKLKEAASGRNLGKARIKGAFSYDRQQPRQFTHFSTADKSERHELHMEQQNDEQYQKVVQKRRQEAIMNIHSRLNPNGQQQQWMRQ